MNVELFGITIDKDNPRISESELPRPTLFAIDTEWMVLGWSLPRCSDQPARSYSYLSIYSRGTLCCRETGSVAETGCIRQVTGQQL